MGVRKLSEASREAEDSDGAMERHRRIFKHGNLTDREEKSMLNMTIEQFAEQLDELLEIRQALLEKQKAISCDVANKRVLVFDENMLVRFARQEGLPIVVENGGTKESCRYSYSLVYKGVELSAYSSWKTYENFRKEGLLQ